MQLHLHLSLGLEVLGLLVCLGDTAPLNLVLQLEVLLIHTPLLGKRLLNLIVAHELLVFKVLDARLSNTDVDLDKI